MKTFKSWQSFHHFEQSVKKKNRYIYDSDVRDFLQTVLETSKSKIEKIKKGGILWRAQIGNDWEPHYEGKEYIDDFPRPFNRKRMKPLEHLACEGRANAKGIPYLYLSTDKETAMAEVRPWIGSYISISQFKLIKDVTLVTCVSEDKGYKIYFKEPKPQKREIAVWKDIDKAFSRPVSQNENIADYVPTQIIAEFFKNNGLDGIAYRSSLGNGHNLALFNIDVADSINLSLYEASEVRFNFKQVANTYYLEIAHQKRGRRRR